MSHAGNGRTRPEGREPDAGAAGVSVAEARRYVLDRCRPLAVRPCPIEDAAGSVLAGTVRSTQAVPPFANSAMDGYAVRAADTQGAPVCLHVVATVMAGDNPTARVGQGDAARIMTGAPIPPGADSVCRLEHARSEPGSSMVVIEESLGPRANVRRAGGDIEAGADVFLPGTVLAPAHIGVLASLGASTVLVYGRPRVAVMATGDELRSGPEALAPGQIRDANRPALLAQLRADGFEPVDLGTVTDTEAAVAHALERGAATCDAVVATGGVSVGDHDLVKVVLQTLCGASMRWMQVAVKPAKPFAFGTLAPAGVPLFGLPGNPVAALVSYELFVRPGLRAMAGHRAVDRLCFSAVAQTDLRRCPDGKLHLVRVTATVDDGGAWRVRPSGAQASHMLADMANANALALLPDGLGVAQGERVDVLLLEPGPGRPPPW